MGKTQSVNYITGKYPTGTQKAITIGDGVLSDGEYNVTDFQNNFNETLKTALESLEQTGGTILILEGNYSLTGNINISNSNINIVGSGPSTVIETGDYSFKIKGEDVFSSPPSLPSSIPSGNITRIFRFDESGTDILNSKTNTTIQNALKNNLTRINFSPVGYPGDKSLKFDGTDKHVNFFDPYFPHTTDFNLSSQLSFSLWVYAINDGKTEKRTILAQKSGDEGFSFYIRGQYIIAEWKTTETVNNSTVDYYKRVWWRFDSYDKWTHLVLSLNFPLTNLENDMILYIDGEFVKQAASENDAFSSDPPSADTVLGVDNGVANTQYPFLGYIDDLIFYDILLNQNQVSDLYNSYIYGTIDGVSVSKIKFVTSNTTPAIILGEEPKAEIILSGSIPYEGRVINKAPFVFSGLDDKDLPKTDSPYNITGLYDDVACHFKFDNQTDPLYETKSGSVPANSNFDILSGGKVSLEAGATGNSGFCIASKGWDVQTEISSRPVVSLGDPDPNLPWVFGNRKSWLPAAIDLPWSFELLVETSELKAANDGTSLIGTGLGSGWIGGIGFNLVTGGLISHKLSGVYWTYNVWVSFPTVDIREFSIRKWNHIIFSLEPTYTTFNNDPNRVESITAKWFLNGRKIVEEVITEGKREVNGTVQGIPLKELPDYTDSIGNNYSYRTDLDPARNQTYLFDLTPESNFSRGFAGEAKIDNLIIYKTALTDEQAKIHADAVSGQTFRNKVGDAIVIPADIPQSRGGKGAERDQESIVPDSSASGRSVYFFGTTENKVVVGTDKIDPLNPAQNVIFRKNDNRSFTYEFWFKPDEIPAVNRRVLAVFAGYDEAIDSYPDGNVGKKWAHGLFIDVSSGNISFIKDETASVSTTPFSVAANQAYYLAYVYDGTNDTVTIYLGSGSALNTPYTISNVSFTASDPLKALWIGGSATTDSFEPLEYSSQIDSFKGYIDNVAFYDRALTIDEITDNFLGGSELSEIIDPESIGLSVSKNITMTECIFEGQGSNPSPYNTSDVIFHWKLDDVGSQLKEEISGSIKNDAVFGASRIKGNLDYPNDSALRFKETSLTYVNTGQNVFDSNKQLLKDTTIPFTLELWFKLYERPTGPVYLVTRAKDSGQSGLGKWVIHIDDPTLSGEYLEQDIRFWFVSSNGDQLLTLTQSDDFVNKGWNHLAITYDGLKSSNSVAVYLNGTEISVNTSITGTPTDDTGIDDNSVILIGGRGEIKADNSIITGVLQTGGPVEINNVIFYNRVLTANEVSESYRKQLGISKDIERRFVTGFIATGNVSNTAKSEL